MQRLKNNDRGAVAVIVALMIVPIMIIAALAIDVAAMHADRQQLQSGADASALAVAQDCARDDCGDTGDTAQAMTAANFNGEGATGSITDFDASAGEVSVQTSSIREHWFGPIAGIDQTELQANSSARWGYPTGGTAVMPLAISWCEFEDQDDIYVERDSSGAVTEVTMPPSTPDRVIKAANLSSSSPVDCNSPSGGPAGEDHHELPGGFSWLSTGGICGETESVIDGWVGSDTGASVPSDCSVAQLESWIGQTVLLPIFYEVQGEGNNGEYRIYGYAAFTLSGYRFPRARYPSSAPCSAPDRCISGTFDRFVDLSENFEYSPDSPRMGASVVALTAE